MQGMHQRASGARFINNSLQLCQLESHYFKRAQEIIQEEFSWPCMWPTWFGPIQSPALYMVPQVLQGVAQKLKVKKKKKQKNNLETLQNGSVAKDACLASLSKWVQSFALSTCTERKPDSILGPLVPQQYATSHLQCSVVIREHCKLKGETPAHIYENHSQLNVGPAIHHSHSTRGRKIGSKYSCF